MEQVNKLKAAISAFFAVLTYLWGWFGWLTIAWIGFMALDVITGMAAACKEGNWSSSIARQGLWHKTGSVIAVIMAGSLDITIGIIVENMGLQIPFTYECFLCPIVMVWYILTETGSIIENVGKLGAPFPSWLTKAMKAFKDKIDDSQENKK